MASLSLEVCIVRVFAFNFSICVFLIGEKCSGLFLRFPPQKSVAVLLCSSREAHDVHESLVLSFFFNFKFSSVLVLRTPAVCESKQYYCLIPDINTLI